MGHTGGYSSAQNCLPLAQNTVRHHCFQRGKSAALQQNIVRSDFGDKALLCRYGNDLVQRDTEYVGACATLAVHLCLHLLCRVQRVPEGVNLVEHHKPGVQTVCGGCEVVPPDRQIGARNSGIRTEDEHHRVGLWDEVDRELWFRSHRIEAWSIQNHQPLLEQRVWNVDKRVAPHGHLYQALRIGQRILIDQIVMPEPQGPCGIEADRPHVRDLFQRLCNLVRVPYIERDFHPPIRLQSPFGQALCLQTGLDGEQAKAWRHLGVIPEFCGAHRGSPGACGHDAAAVVCKKNGVDQLGFAPRKLCNKRHHHFVASHLRFQTLQTLLHACIHQLM